MVSQRHTILLGGCIPHVDDALPCCFASRSLMPTLLPVGDEFRMNFEGLGVPFSTCFCCFPQLFSELGANFAENVARIGFLRTPPNDVLYSLHKKRRTPVQRTGALRGRCLLLQPNLARTTIRGTRGPQRRCTEFRDELLRTPLLRSSRGKLTYPIAPALMLQVAGRGIGHSLRSANISLQ